ncbi:hypothetical protein E3T55_01285 [Cryobacterium frigoriphilum]|uniref:Uncharacterized protein n=1 Tax=Cryobacterium frigoriphilum TaxID=1259150 RepID=A0A4R9AAT2_9MICO|nr:hypothetical protein [Cryobacterium frigoriphilum]TFD55417.1 hypothetical protein E3T55_01285 [Cryobacterium frigoriphilum]
MRPHFRNFLPKLVALALAVGLSGCSAATEPAPPTSTPSPTTAVAPVFANDDEALAAAIEAYAAYQEMFTAVAAEGAINPERMQAVTSGSYEDLMLQDLSDARAAGLRTTGTTTFDGVMLQRVDESAPSGTSVVVLYLCSDVSQVDVLDANDVSQVDADRIPRTALEVGFDWEQGRPGVLTVGSRVAWTGDGVC